MATVRTIPSPVPVVPIRVASEFMTTLSDRAICSGSEAMVGDLRGQAAAPAVTPVSLAAIWQSVAKELRTTRVAPQPVVDLYRREPVLHGKATAAVPCTAGESSMWQTVSDAFNAIKSASWTFTKCGSVEETINPTGCGCDRRRVLADRLGRRYQGGHSSHFCCAVVCGPDLRAGRPPGRLCRLCLRQGGTRRAQRRRRLQPALPDPVRLREAGEASEARGISARLRKTADRTGPIGFHGLRLTPCVTDSVDGHNPSSASWSCRRRSPPHPAIDARPPRRSAPAFTIAPAP